MDQGRSTYVFYGYETATASTVALLDISRLSARSRRGRQRNPLWRSGREADTLEADVVAGASRNADAEVRTRDPLSGVLSRQCLDV